MKKYLSAPLCSALVVPGMGQIINRHLRKGLVLLGVVFLLLIAATVEFFRMLQSLSDTPAILESGLSGVGHQIQTLDFSRLRVILVLSLIVWFYSVIDAFFYGFKWERANR